MPETDSDTTPISPILVVDDNPAAAAAAAATLVAAGLPARCDIDCEAALRFVRAERVRVLVSEIYVPCSEGPCVVAVLKGDRHRLPRLRVLVHSRHTRPEDIEYAFANGADAFVPQTAPDEVLLREIRRLTALDDQSTGGPGGRAGGRTTGDSGSTP